MHKIKQVQVIEQVQTPDEYGGHTVTEGVSLVFYGVFEAHVLYDKGHNGQFTSYIISKTAVPEPNGKTFRIEGDDWTVQRAIQNRRRWYYELERVR